jgi:hypothetical protein
MVVEIAVFDLAISPASGLAGMETHEPDIADSDEERDGPQIGLGENSHVLIARKKRLPDLFFLVLPSRAPQKCG